MKPQKIGFIDQYNITKEQYKDCIVFFRMGDFYELFYDDAITITKELDLTLTHKGCGKDEPPAPMCGVPYHAVNQYVAKILEKGHKIAICEQMGEVKPGQLVKREVLRVITPGTVTETDLLEQNKNNYLLSLCKMTDKFGACYVDISTGEFNLLQLTDNLESELTDLLSRITPSEVICNQQAKQFYDALPVLKLGIYPKAQEYYDWAYAESRANVNLENQFGENYQKVYELASKKHLICAAGATLEYVQETQKKLLKSINTIKIVKNNKFLGVDMNTRRNLELVETIRERKRHGSLLWMLDKTRTSMGARRLKKYFDEPLQDSKEINDRLNAVEELVKKLILRDKLNEVLGGVSDIERLAGRIASGAVYPKDMLSLKTSLQLVPQIKEALSGVQSARLNQCLSKLIDFSDIADLLERAIDPECPNVMKDGGFIRRGFNAQLDEYRDAREKGKIWIKELEKKEQEETGIKNLRIDCNKVFGYFIEVNKSLSNQVPLRYIRKQTVANNERYITDDLKVIEEKILGSDEKAIKLELIIFEKLRETLQEYVALLQQIANSICELDALLSLAKSAVAYNFTKPTINSNIKHIKIIDGRHPVVERFAKSGAFIPNDTYLDNNLDRTMVITGPNMAGKSTYMRQVAIITFMAHIGSFVPAAQAEIAITDRIFSRVGASDDLVFGQSTFMVEMSEVATILANATDKSLIILDEIGRGTSTFDGLSIAWSVIEYVSQHFKAKTLFATHYHELTDLEGVLDGVKNYKVAVKELDDSVMFLRKILRGGANKSFGIEVARLAGLPQEVLDRAKEISANLERLNTKLDLDIFKDKKEKAQVNTKRATELLNRLKDVDINRLSPMAAFDLLNDLVQNAKED